METWPREPEARCCWHPESELLGALLLLLVPWACLAGVCRRGAQVVLRREKEPQKVRGGAPVFPHQRTEYGHGCSGNHVLYLEPHSKGTSPRVLEKLQTLWFGTRQWLRDAGNPLQPGPSSSGPQTSLVILTVELGMGSWDSWGVQLTPQHLPYLRSMEVGMGQRPGSPSKAWASVAP